MSRWASAAPHPLAEAICELAAPPVRPTCLLMSMSNSYEGSTGVLLHIRPRGRLATGIEVAVQCATMKERDEESVGWTSPQADCYFLGDGVEAFVDSFLESGGLLGYDDFPACILRLPRDCEKWHQAWNDVELELFAAKDLRITQDVPGYLGERVEFRLPSSTTKLLCSRNVASSASSYVTQQRSYLKQKKEREKMEKQQQQQHEPGDGSSAVAPTPAPIHPLERVWYMPGKPEPGEPDSPECVRQRWKELRGNDMEEVRTTLVGMLKMACAYRERVVLQPIGGVAAPQAAQEAAAGADPGAPAGGA